MLTLKDEADVKVNVLKTSGVSVYQASFGSLPAGQQVKYISLHIPTGVYVVKLTIGKNTLTTITIKQ
jgi:hypothetical protein